MNRRRPKRRADAMEKESMNDLFENYSEQKGNTYVNN